MHTLSLRYPHVFNFNSIKVQLKHEETRYLDIAHVEFQFHKGTIKTCDGTLRRRSSHYFNSIKVQLKLKNSYQDNTFAEFQFHKGTIKTQRNL